MAHTPRHVVCTGGGTAGHVVPLKPVIVELLARGHRVTFVGSRGTLEADLVRDLDIPYAGVATGKLRRYLSLENVVDAFRVVVGICQAVLLLRRLAPDVVCSKGGYVSVPVVLAAGLLRIPVLAHESDLTPGLANRLALKVARTVCVSFAETRITNFAGRVVHTGSPVRDELLNGSAAAGRERLGADDASILLITGGSLGAAALNDAVAAAAPRLVERFFVVHVTGAGKRSAFEHPRYRQFEFVGPDWGDLLAAADFVVSRAGATTLFELLALGKPSLLVPLPATHSRGDQLENADIIGAAGYALVCREADLIARGLAAAVDVLERAAPALEKALATFEAPHATDALVREVLALAGA